ncbi:MAG TPA: glycosyltransferase [Humisphaera sp.]
MTKQVGIFRLQLFKVSEPFVHSQAAGLRGYEPVFVGDTVFGPAPAGARCAVCRAAGAGLLARRVLRTTGHLRRALAPYRLDLLHAHFAVDAVYAVPLARRLGVPLVTTLHGFDVTRSTGSMIRSMRPALVNAVLWRRSVKRATARFLCVSDFIRRAAVARGFPPDKLVVHYIGIDTAALAPPPAASRDPALVVHVARLVEKKGTRVLLQAFARLAGPRGRAARLVVVGDGPLRPALERAAADLGVAHRVSFLGSRPNAEVHDLFRRATLVAVPSVPSATGDAEGLPIVILEAQALGAPVVASDSGGIAEAVRDGRTGFLTRPHDADALSDRISAILESPDLADRLSRGARANVEREFDVRRQCQKLEGIYDDVRAEGVMASRLMPTLADGRPDADAERPFHGPRPEGAR